MNTIKQLIEKYCPDGVEYKKLGEVCKTIPAPVKVKTSQYFKKGKYAIIDQGQSKIAGYTNDEFILIPKGEYVLYGDHTCTVKYVNFRFAQGADGLKILKTEQLLTKYLYYALSNFNIKNNEYKRHWSIVKEIYIPVPPISVQREIVRILDSFTSLEAELEAELEARRKQYEYYRDQLLSFKHLSGGGKNEVEWKTIKDVCLSICSGGTPNTQNKDFYNGNIPWLRTQEVDWKDIYKTDVLITEAGLKNSSAKLIPANCVIVAMYGATAAKVAINKIPLTTNQACCNLQIDESICNNRYVYQWLCKNYEVLKAMGEGSQQNLNAKKIKNFPIPIPPLSTQRRIVSILDRFESLVNDITTGLPAEIAARRQQYEYYRDQLLSFKRKS